MDFNQLCYLNYSYFLHLSNVRLDLFASPFFFFDHILCIIEEGHSLTVVSFSTQAFRLWQLDLFILINLIPIWSFCKVQSNDTLKNITHTQKKKKKKPTTSPCQALHI